MELKNLREYLEFKMEDNRRLKEKSRFKLARTEGDPTLMLHIRSKYRSKLYHKTYTQETVSIIYDKEGIPVSMRRFAGDKVVTFDDIKRDLDDLRIEETVFPSTLLCTKGDLLYTKSLYLAKVGVEKYLRGQGIASRLMSDLDKYSQVNGFEKVYGHGCAFGSTYPQRRTPEEEQFLKELIIKYHLRGVSEDDKNLILFYMKKGYIVDGEISRMRDGIIYPFAFSKKVDSSQQLSANDTLFFKDSVNKFDRDNIFLS